jgi:hypothetical protein
MSAPPGWPAGHWPEACCLEFFVVLAGEEPADLCEMAGVVDLLGAGRDDDTLTATRKHRPARNRATGQRPQQPSGSSRSPSTPATKAPPTPPTRPPPGRHGLRRSQACGPPGKSTQTSSQNGPGQLRTPSPMAAGRQTATAGSPPNRTPKPPRRAPTSTTRPNRSHSQRCSV